MYYDGEDMDLRDAGHGTDSNVDTLYGLPTDVGQLVDGRLSAWRVDRADSVV